MFDSSSWTDARTLRVFDPPRPVLVDMSIVDPTAGRPFGFSPTGVSLHVRANGVVVERAMPAEQVAWVRMFDGQWRAVVAVALCSANQRSTLAVHLWVPPAAVRPHRRPT